MSDNELIAEFMPKSGTFYLDPTNGISLCESEHLEYHTSWDWLMPVVHKIATMPLDYNIPQYNLCNASVEKPLWYIYERVIIFIKWYNTQKDQPK